MSEETKFLAKRQDITLVNKKDDNESFEFPAYSYRQNVDIQNNEINYYLKLLFKYKWSIAICVAVTLTASWYLLSKVQPLYLASGAIQIDPETINPLDNKTKYYQAWLDPEYFNTQLKLLSNPTLAKQVVEKLNLTNEPDLTSNRPTTVLGAFFEVMSFSPKEKENPAPTPTNKTQEVPDSPELQKQEDEKIDAAANYVLANLQVSPISKTRLVSISFRHHNPQLAEKIANAVAITFIQNNLNKRTGASQNASNFLQKRLAELQSDIHQAEEELINYGKLHEIVSLTGEENTVAERLTTLNKQLLEAEAARKELEAIYKVVKSGASTDSIPEVQTNKTIQTLQERLSMLKQKREELLSVYTEEWPEYKQVIQTIKQIEKDIQSEKAKIVEGIEVKYTAALEREKLLKTDFEKQMGTTLKQNENAINYKIKQQEIETKKELYKTVLSQLKESDISASSDINNIVLTTRAAIPKSEISPQRTLVYVWAIFLSTLGGFGLALIREHLNNKIKTVEDIDRFVKLPTLGSIPNFRTPELMDGATSIFDLQESTAAEAYRHLRTSIILSPQKQNKIILVTSGQPEEGKTVTAINIATSLAHTGARTVIIEADLRKPNLHPLFQTSGSNGLTQYLSGYTSLENLVQETEIANLATIPLNGPRPMYPAELLGSPRMIELLKYLAATRDYVIIDTPPVLPFADAAILSAHVDSVLVVVNAEKSRREIVRRTCRILEDVRANILGIVLNNAGMQEISYDYSYKYRYSKYNKDSAGAVFKKVVSALREIGGTSELPQIDEKGLAIKKIEISDDVDEKSNAENEEKVTKPNIQIVLTKELAKEKNTKTPKLISEGEPNLNSQQLEQQKEKNRLAKEVPLENFQYQKDLANEETDNNTVIKALNSDSKTEQTNNNERSTRPLRNTMQLEVVTVTNNPKKETSTTATTNSFSFTPNLTVSSFKISTQNGSNGSNGSNDSNEKRNL